MANLNSTNRTNKNAAGRLRIPWSEALEYYGSGLTFVRRSKIEGIFKEAIPLNIATEQAMRFKNEIKQLVIKAIENCENQA